MATLDVQEAILVRVEYKLNKRTKVLHRRVIMPDNGQVLTGEQCNIDQIQEAAILASAGDEKRCRHCFG